MTTQARGSGRRPGARLRVLLALGAGTTGLALGPAAPASASSAGTLSVIAGLVGQSGMPAPGPATATPLGLPAGVAVDTNGDVYVADSSDNVVERITPTGTLSVIAGTGVAGPPTPGPATASRLDAPAAVAVDGAGNVYVADWGNAVVERITPAGTLSVVAGDGRSSAPPTPGRATASALEPVALAVGPGGSLVVGAANGDEVVGVGSAGGLSVLAGTGESGTPTPGPATASALGDPGSLAVDGAGDVFVGDAANAMVEEVDTAGILSVVAGTGTPGPATPGPATASDLGGPVGVAVGPDGGVDIADTYNDVIEQVADGMLSVVAGTGTPGTPTPGPAVASQLDGPSALAVDGVGDLVIADAGNGVVESVVPPGLAPILQTGTPPPSVAATGVPYRYVFAVSGTPAPVLSLVGTLPPGLVFDPATGVLSGTPTASGLFVFTVTATAASGSVTSQTVALRTVPAVVALADTRHGYLLVTAAGAVRAVGTPYYGAPVAPRSPVVGIAATADGGYLVATAAGNVYAFHTHWYGAPARAHHRLRVPVTGITAEPGGGYALVTASGRIDAYGPGRAPGHQLRLAGAVGVAATRTGWIVVSATGRAVIYRPRGPARVRLAVYGPVAAVTTAGTGYLVVTTGGQVDPVDTVANVPEIGGFTPPPSPVVGIAGLPGSGYRLASEDGGISTGPGLPG